MAKVKMLTLLSGPSGSVAPGRIHECPEAEAARLVAGGYAEAVAEAAPEPAPAPIPPAPEPVALAPEKAAPAASKKKKGA